VVLVKEKAVDIDRNSAAVLGFAALVHELTGRVASVLMLSKDLTVHANRHDPTWLDERLARVYRAASEMQRNMDAGSNAGPSEYACCASTSGAIGADA
jgi:hypothetical protein